MLQKLTEVVFLPDAGCIVDIEDIPAIFPCFELAERLDFVLMMLVGADNLKSSHVKGE